MGVPAICSVASQVHALLEANKYLNKKKKENYFCSPEPLTTQDVFTGLKEISALKGNVSAELVTSFIASSLREKYPCK